jgi:hypothetical protein
MSTTERDTKMVKEWFEIYKYASISMLERTFFPTQEYSYNICRKRLGELLKNDYIKVFKDDYSNRNIYVYNEPKLKMPSAHRLVLLDLLAEMKYLGFNVERFEIEKQWCGGKYRSDAFVQFTVDNPGEGKGVRKYFFVEVMTSNNYHHLEKYDDIFPTGEVQQYLGKDKSFMPKILLIADRHFSNIKLKSTEVLQLDTKLKSFASILIA